MKESSLIDLADCENNLIEAYKKITSSFHGYASKSGEDQDEEENQMMNDLIQKIDDRMKSLRKTVRSYRDLAEIRKYRGVSER